MAKNHVVHLGKLVGNLQSMEALLRAYLLNIEKKRPPSKPVTKPYWDLAVGDVIDEDEFSNYDTLGKLVNKFNNDIAARDRTLVVDDRVIEVRDLLAHGRVAAESPNTEDLKIVKFSKPSGGKVTVVSSALMSDAWFTENTALALEQIQKVARAIEKYAA